MIPKEILEEIKAKAAKDLPNDYITQSYVVNANVDAWERLNDEAWNGKKEGDVFPPKINPEAELKSIREELGLPANATSVGILTEIRGLKKTRTPEMVGFSEQFDARTGLADLKLNKYAEYVAKLGEKLADVKNEKSKRITDKNELEKLVTERNSIADELNEIGRFLEKTEWEPGGYVLGNKK